MAEGQRPCCATCKFIEPSHGDLLCRRFPPVGTTVLKPGTSEVVNATAWPIVQPFEWCGEHRYA